MRVWILAAALRVRCLAQVMQLTTSLTVVESTTWMARRRRQSFFGEQPRAKAGHWLCRCLSMCQKSCSAIEQSRVLLAWLSVLGAGARAARMANRSLMCNLSASHTSLSPIARLTCA